MEAMVGETLIKSQVNLWKTATAGCDSGPDSLTDRVRQRTKVCAGVLLERERCVVSRNKIFPMGVLAVWLLMCGALHAQALLNIRVGDTPSKLSKFGPVSGEDKYKTSDIFKWVFSNRNALSATVDPEGEIVYLESDWGGKTEETGCDLAGLKFGVTTLADLRKRFGSNGFGFKKRPHVAQTEGGIVLLNSWEVGTVVVTFYTTVNMADYTKVQAAEAAEPVSDYAKLDAISMANAAYARSEWGERVADPAYKKIEWK